MPPSPERGDDFRVARRTAEMAEALEAIQRASFPELAADERIRAEQFRAHIDVFPEGQLVVVDRTGRPVASSTDIRRNIDLDRYQHRYMEVSGDNWLTSHDPEGEWLYGIDIGIHPDWRGRGLSRLLYDARKDIVRRLDLRGHVAGGLPVGYGAVKRQISIEDYLSRVEAGEIFDPTLSVQLRRGFRIRGILHDYVHNPACDDKAALIVWLNPDRREG